jgi:hypothetical protein
LRGAWLDRIVEAGLDYRRTQREMVEIVEITIHGSRDSAIGGELHPLDIFGDGQLRHGSNRDLAADFDNLIVR